MTERIMPVPEGSERIRRILKEETDDFILLRHHFPVGREIEDVVDNALTRIRRFDKSIPYARIDDLYTEIVKHDTRRE